MRFGLEQIKDRHLFLVLIAVTALIKVAFLAGYGPKFGGDSAWYLTVAKGFSELELSPLAISHSHYFTYWLYPLLLAPAFWVGEWFVPYYANILQALLALVGVGFLYKSLRLAFAPVIAFLASGLFIGLYEVHYWDIMLYTDSLNLSLLMVSGYFTYRSLLRQQVDLHIHGPLGLLLILSRPVNVVYLGVQTVFILGRYVGWDRILTRRRTVLTVNVVMAGLVIGAAALGVRKPRGVPMAGPFSQETIVDRPSYDAVVDPLTAQASVLDRITFGQQVVAKRFVYFWLPIVDRYSRSHNVWNALTLIPFLLLGFLGLFFFGQDNRTRILLGFSLAIVLTYNMFHALTIVDFDFRYRLVVLPFLCWMVALSLGQLEQFWSWRKLLVKES